MILPLSLSLHSWSQLLCYHDQTGPYLRRDTKKEQHIYNLIPNKYSSYFSNELACDQALVFGFCSQALSSARARVYERQTRLLHVTFPAPHPLLDFRHSLPVPIYTTRWRGRHCENYVSCPRTHHNVPGQGWNPDRSTTKSPLRWPLGHRCKRKETGAYTELLQPVM